MNSKQAERRKIRAEIHATGNRKIEKIDETKMWFFYKNE